MPWYAHYRALSAFALFVVVVLVAVRIYPIMVLDATDTGRLLGYEAQVSEVGRKDAQEQGEPGVQEEGNEGDPHQDPGQIVTAPASEIEWLISCQLPNGAIAQTPDGVLVIPYFANLAARQLAEVEPERCAVYMDWYIANLNMPDRWGLSGTIYDFSARDGELRSTRKYDSADSYASTFLSLVAHYYRTTGDADYVRNNKDAIDIVAGVISALQDNDGLVRVAPNSGTKYLMDNAENYRGLMDWADTLDSLGFSDEADQYRLMADNIKQGIETVLKRSGGDDYAWSYSWLGKRYPRRGKWYPDAVSQVFLISCGLMPPDDTRAQVIWDRFNQDFPRWELGETDDDFPWAEMAVASVMMNDLDRANRFLEWVAAEYAERQYPWHVLESSNRVKVESMLQSPP